MTRPVYRSEDQDAAQRRGVEARIERIERLARKAAVAGGTFEPELKAAIWKKLQPLIAEIAHEMVHAELRTLIEDAVEVAVAEALGRGGRA